MTDLPVVVPVPEAEAELARLLSIMAALRTPVTGCPWDLEQTFRTVAPYTLEEAAEVVDAIERDDMVDLVDELGDLDDAIHIAADIAGMEGEPKVVEPRKRFSFRDIIESRWASVFPRLELNTGVKLKYLMAF